MDQLAEQISSACQVALDPSPNVAQEQRHGAYAFLQQVKDASQETWQACWKLFLEQRDGGGGASNEARMFALQVVTEALPSLGADALAVLQTSLFEYFSREFVHGSAEGGVSFVKNAVTHFAAAVFLYTYPAIAPTFFSSLLALLRTYPPSFPVPSTSTSSAPLNPQTTDLFLRILHEVSLEISDAQLRLNKSSQRLSKDTELRDAIRENDAASIAAAVWGVIGEAVAGVDLPDGEAGDAGRVGLKGKTAREVAEMAVRVAGDYVSWIDINLMVTPATIGLLLQCINLPSPLTITIRSATADTLIETVGKGMPASDKLKLFEVLDVGTLLAALQEVGREGGKREAESEDVELLRTKLARLLNGVGTELCKIIDDSASPADAKMTASNMATSLLPLLLRFLVDPRDETSISVHPFATSILSVYKKEKKRAGAGNNMPDPTMTDSKRAFLSELLKGTVSKMAYADEAEWDLALEGEEDEDQRAFDEMRKNLRVIGDAVAWIDPELYAEGVRGIILETIDLYEAGGAKDGRLSWQRIELALAMLYGFGQAISSQGPGAFVQVPVTEIQRAKREAEYRIDYTQFPLSQLGELMLRACRSKIVNYPHAAVSLQFFEVVVRYHDFFKLCPEFITELLPSFLDEHGLHQPEEAVQARVFYLFSRFIHQAKGIVQSQVSGDLVRSILTGMQDLLVVNAALPDSEPPSELVLTKAAGTTSFFDAQLYVFETAGTLISILNQIPDQQVVLLKAVLDPLLADLQNNVRPAASSPEDFNAIFKAHHLIMAAASVAKGFPDLSARSPTATGAWVDVFVSATETILASAKVMSSFVVIRDAARFAFNRIVATTGQAVLPLIPTFIDCLVGQITFPELADLLSFLGLLVAKYKTNFLEILDTLLLPVVNRVFHFLSLPIAGTDDMVQHSTLRRAYFNFILSIAGANLQEVFYSEKNKDHLQSILQSITHYIANDSLAPDQRYGFGVLNKLLLIWVDQYRPPTAPPLANGTAPPPSPVPGFERFLYEQAVKLCFEVPLKADFDYSDAQSFQVIGEIAVLLKALLQKRGNEFVEFMTTSFFPSINCPPEASAPFMTALQEAPDGKQFKKFLGEWLRTNRGPAP
ncbi:pre-tRNA nuclear export protein [Rhodotorula mucilaginosa]|uniref:Exportin-T n=1 Tax=Rhodotorula mucilaginosa TaxID=5537 RepID=A0A9P6VT07_RHOMI|nr:pre-tRNA nuclear export protein [Rhodotorula mucilaginosa]